MKRRHLIRIATIAATSRLLAPARAEQTVVLGASSGSKINSEIVELLRTLPPLPKVHYFWPPNTNALSDEILLELVRITGNLSIRGEILTDTQRQKKNAELERIVQLLTVIGSATPRSVSLGIHYSPWHHRFGKELPPTDDGPTAKEELRVLRESFWHIADTLSKIAPRHTSTINISAVLLDCERFRIRTGKDSERWNVALRAKYDETTNIAKEAFPGAKVIWYARGASTYNYRTGTWGIRNHFDLSELGDGLSVPLYSPPYRNIMREMFSRTAKRARDDGFHEVTPWIALGSGYQRDEAGVIRWTFDWNYPDEDIAWLGAEVNQISMARHSTPDVDWSMAKAVVFYPGPFRKQSPSWLRHFTAYVRGASRDT